MAFADDLQPPPGGVLPGDALLLIRPGANGAPAKAYGIPPAQLGPGGAAESGQPLPIAFVMPGKPAPGALFNVVMTTPCAVPANLAGSQGFAGSAPSSVSGGGGGTFTVRKIAAADGTASPLGAASFAPGASRATLSQQLGAALSPGDVLQLAAPAAPDAALADLCITILAFKA